jgi:hypothetical protein
VEGAVVVVRTGALDGSKFGLSDFVPWEKRDYEDC